MSKILVTGGCGFIGTVLVRRLADAGNTVRILDNMSRGSGEGLPGSGVSLIEGDVRDPEVVARSMDGVDTVVHLAAYGSVVESVTDPVTNYQQNVEGTFTVLHQAWRAGVRKLVFASTGGALIGDAHPPVNEDSVPRPISPYGASKLCGEGYCHAFGRAYGMETVALRFANVYGPHSAHKKGAVTAFIKAVMADKPMVIFGDGGASRDFLYVEDLCAGIESALATSLEPGTVLHLASGEETTVAGLARLVARAGGRPEHPIDYQERRPGEVERNFARYDRAREALGFEPRWSLQQGLEATWQWFREQGDAALQAATSDS